MKIFNKFMIKLTFSDRQPWPAQIVQIPARACEKVVVDLGVRLWFFLALSPINYEWLIKIATIWQKK